MIKRYKQDGYTLVVDRSRNPPRIYKEKDGKEIVAKRNPEGLGDRLERELTRMGITQDRYKEIKERFGFPPTCDCEKRKQWLNKVGRWVGL